MIEYKNLESESNIIILYNNNGDNQYIDFYDLISKNQFIEILDDVNKRYLNLNFDKIIDCIISDIKIVAMNNILWEHKKINVLLGKNKYECKRAGLSLDLIKENFNNNDGVKLFNHQGYCEFTYINEYFKFLAYIDHIFLSKNNKNEIYLRKIDETGEQLSLFSNKDFNRIINIFPSIKIK